MKVTLFYLLLLFWMLPTVGQRIDNMKEAADDYKKSEESNKKENDDEDPDDEFSDEIARAGCNLLLQSLGEIIVLNQQFVQAKKEQIDYLSNLQITSSLGSYPFGTYLWQNDINVEHGIFGSRYRHLLFVEKDDHLILSDWQIVQLHFVNTKPINLYMGIGYALDHYNDLFSTEFATGGRYIIDNSHYFEVQYRNAWRMPNDKAITLKHEGSFTYYHLLAKGFTAKMYGMVSGQYIKLYGLDVFKGQLGVSFQLY